MELIAYFGIAFVLSAVAGTREKRLVLHSDTDIATEVLNLRSEMENQKIAFATEVASIKSAMLHQNANLTAKHDNATAKLQAEIDSLTSSNNKLNNELSSLKSAFTTETNHEHGSVYVRWGRTVCPGNGSTLVYKGYMAGSDHTEPGNGANHLCLPEDPTWAKYTDANDGSRAHIDGTEFEEFTDLFFGKHVGNQDVPCAVCKSPGVTVMIPARANCYQGLNLEYTGYLMAQYYNSKIPTEYACLDADPEFVPRGHASTDGHILYLVQSKCKTLVCPPYYEYRELACSVCST